MGHKIMSSSIHEGVLPYVCIYYYSKGERIRMVISAKCNDIDGNPRIWASFDDPIYKKKTIQLYDCSTIVKAKCMFCFMEKDGLFSRLLIAIVHCKVPAVVITYSAMQSACPRQAHAMAGVEHAGDPAVPRAATRRAQPCGAELGDPSLVPRGVEEEAARGGCLHRGGRGRDDAGLGCVMTSPGDCKCYSC